jgi:hypothetical protein
VVYHGVAEIKINQTESLRRTSELVKTTRGKHFSPFYDISTEKQGKEPSTRWLLDMGTRGDTEEEVELQERCRVKVETPITMV